MSLITIPTTNDPFYKQVTALDGVDYTLTFTYDQREDCFYLTIGDATDVDIVRGIKLVCLWPLLLGKVDDRLPQGTLMVISNTTDDSPPGIDDLIDGGRCELVYQEVE